jgi:hypothetical protein
MPDIAPEFEVTNDLGYTFQYSGTVGTTAIQVPPSPFRPVDSILIRCPQQPSTRRLEVSFDYGANWLSLAPSEYLIWEPRRDSSGNDIQQVTIRGNTAGVLYESLVNFSNTT